MAAEPCSAERADGDMSKENVKRDKKKKKEGKKKKEEEAGTEGQEQPSDATGENLAAARDEIEGKQSNKSKKSKRERGDAGEASAGDQAVAREDKKRKKEHPTALEESNQKQALDTAVKNSVAKSDKVEGKQSSKSKKSKSKCDHAGEASACDQAVTRDDKKIKKKHPVLLEESSQPKNSKVENVEIKERRTEADKSIPESTENASAGGEEADGDVKNDKKKKKSKEGTEQEGIQKKEKASQSKNKGKGVSFADSTEVFETKGGNAEGTEGGNKKEKKAAQPKNKGKRVSFADSAEVIEGGDGEGTEGGKRKKIKVAQSKNKGKRVSFADSAEMFETEGGDNEEGGSSDKSEFVHGLRFTPDEDAILMEAITDFIEMKQLGEKGLEMFRNPRKHKELMNCWDVIGKSLPHRPYNAIYRRARTLLNRSDKRGWTKDEIDRIRSFVQNNGTDWKTLARELGKWTIHVKDAWRRTKSPNLKKGHWTQDEHQKLFDLVNLDLRMKAHESKHSDNRKLRDNISWEAISDKLTTRNHKNCCLKWYDTLASPMVREGIWADVDDYLLVEALQKDDAVCIEDVHWDSLLDHRSGEVCRQRWNQMVRGLGGHREKPFIEQVDVLSGRYCPEMIEYRKDSEETRAGDADGDKKKKKLIESEEEPGVANAEVEKRKKRKSKESEEPGVANAEIEKKNKKSNQSEEEPGVANAQVEKKKRKSKESEEPSVANAEVEKKIKKKSMESQEPSVAGSEVEKRKKRKSKESEEPGVANAEVEKKNKKSNQSEEEPGAANAQVEKKKRKSKESEEPSVANAEVQKKLKKKSMESEEPSVASSEVENRKKKSNESEEEPSMASAKVEKKKRKPKESEESGASNAEVEKKEEKKSKESVERDVVNAEVEKKNRKSKDSEEPDAGTAEVKKKKKTKKTVTQNDEVVVMETE